MYSYLGKPSVSTVWFQQHQIWGEQVRSEWKMQILPSLICSIDKIFEDSNVTYTDRGTEIKTVNHISQISVDFQPTAVIKTENLKHAVVTPLTSSIHLYLWPAQLVGNLAMIYQQIYAIVISGITTWSKKLLAKYRNPQQEWMRRFLAFKLSYLQHTFTLLSLKNYSRLLTLTVLVIMAKHLEQSA